MKKQWCMALLGCLLGLAGRAQVNLQTGSATYQVPLFNFKDAKSGLAADVSLSYSSGYGFKVRSIASHAGTGWDLVAGGVIERQQNGEPDDQYNPVNYGFEPNDLIIKRLQTRWENVDDYYPDGYLYTSFALNGNAKTLGITPRYKKKQTQDYKQSPSASADRQQDIFSCAFGGRMIRFVVEKRSSPSAPFPVSILDDSKVKIDITEADMRDISINTRIKAFKLTDENGLIYYFDTFEKTEVTDKRTAYPNTLASVIDNFYMFRKTRTMGTGHYTVNRWHLSAVENPFTKEKILFSYINFDVRDVVDIVPSRQYFGGTNTYLLDFIETHTYTKALARIDYPDGHQVRISYDTQDRFDLTGDHAINKVAVYYKEEPVKWYDIKTGYFHNTEVVDASAFTSSSYNKKLARLCLRSIRLNSPGAVQMPAYEFGYYTDTWANVGVPSRYSFAYDKDGFFNRTTGRATVTNFYNLKDVSRSSVNSFAYIGLLKTVRSPSGGELSYNYERPDMNMNGGGNNEVLNGARVALTTLHDLATTGTDVITKYQYVQEDGYTSSGWGENDYDNKLQSVAHVKADGNPFVNYNRGGIIAAPSPTALVVTQIVRLVQAYVTAKAIQALGTAIQMEGPLQDIIMPELLNQVPSPDDVFNFVIDGLTGLIDSERDVQIIQWGAMPNTSSNNIPLQFSRVVSVIQSASDMGKTVAEFTKPDDFKAEIAKLEFPYANKFRCDSWKYGLLKVQSVYNANGILVNKKEHSYQFQSQDLSESCKVGPREYYSLVYDWFLHAQQYYDDNWLTRDYYHMKQGRADVVKIAETNYDTTGSQLSYFESEYSYNSNHVPTNIITRNSKGESTGINYFYAGDYNPGLSTALDLMVQKHQLATVITRAQWVEKNGDRRLTAASSADYDVLPDSSIKISKVKRFKAGGGSMISDLTYSVNPANINNYPFFENSALNTYNIYGDLCLTEDEAGHQTTYITGYNHRRIIAKVEHAAPEQVAYTSFEPQTYIAGPYTPQTGYDEGNESRLQINTANIVNNVCPTGDYCYQLNTPVRFRVASGRLLVSLWATSASVRLDGTIVPLRTGPTLNGWTYYEFETDNTSYNWHTVSGDAETFMDELRVYPVGASMQTATYHHTFGQTSTCDLNNRIGYTEYDPLGRVSKLYDESRNLVKTYEYHYKFNN
jgi:hypothetical protein